MDINDIIGSKVGRLYINRFIYRDNKRNNWYECMCDCGKIKKIRRSCLIKKNPTKSCGCLIVERRISKARHRMCDSAFYKRWASMKQRVNNTNTKCYDDYGGRGIKYDISWNKFLCFKDDMYETYSEHVRAYGEQNTTLDRIDVNGDYCKDNCRWATRHDQSRNTRRNIFITINGVKKTLQDWSIDNGIFPSTAYTRIFKFGWPMEDAVTKKSNGNWKTRISPYEKK